MSDTHLLAIREAYSYGACLCKQCVRAWPLNKRQIHRNTRRRLKRRLRIEQE